MRIDDCPIVKGRDEGKEQYLATMSHYLAGAPLPCHGTKTDQEKCNARSSCDLYMMWFVRPTITFKKDVN